MSWEQFNESLIIFERKEMSKFSCKYINDRD